MGLPTMPKPASWCCRYCLVGRDEVMRARTCDVRFASLRREADILAGLQHVRFVPQQPTSFDQFSCLYEELVRYRDAKGFCGLEIDHQIELGRLLDRQIGRLGAFENFIDVVACTAEQIGYIV